MPVSLSAVQAAARGAGQVTAAAPELHFPDPDRTGPAVPVYGSPGLVGPSADFPDPMRIAVSPGADGDVRFAALKAENR